MKIMLLAVLVVGSAFALHVARAQQPGTKRTDLQRHDLSAPGREVVQVRVDFDPGYVAPGTRIPAEEIIYVIEGTLEYQVEGGHQLPTRRATFSSFRLERSTR